ncbi:MAG: hypothetical protein HQ526_10725 [Actinobacteria bacterium]|nr:hypothetical protein [Actinomycetota bacterium]
MALIETAIDAAKNRDFGNPRRAPLAVKVPKNARAFLTTSRRVVADYLGDASAKTYDILALRFRCHTQQRAKVCNPSFLSICIQQTCSPFNRSERQRDEELEELLDGDGFHLAGRQWQ